MYSISYVITTNRILRFPMMTLLSDERLLSTLHCDLFKNRQMSALKDHPSSLCKNETYSSFWSQTQNLAGEIKFHAKLMTLHVGE